MLKTIDTVTYIVYPPWADPGYKWEELPRLMSDPLSTPFAEPGIPHGRGERLLNLGFPREIKPYELIDGPAGGGIIRAGVRLTEKWLPSLILSSRRSELRSPRGSENFPHPRVCHIQPRDGPGVPFGLEEPARLFECSVTAEHAPFLGESVAWIVGYKGKRPEAMEGVVPAAKRFGIIVRSEPVVPPPWLENTSSWFVDPSFKYEWFVVEPGDKDLGYHFAVVLYIALALSGMTKRSVRYMHLLAEMDIPYCVRPKWTRK